MQKSEVVNKKNIKGKQLLEAQLGTISGSLFPLGKLLVNNNSFT